MSLDKSTSSNKDIESVNYLRDNSPLKEIDEITEIDNEKKKQIDAEYNKVVTF